MAQPDDFKFRASVARGALGMLTDIIGEGEKEHDAHLVTKGKLEKTVSTLLEIKANSQDATARKMAGDTLSDL